MGQFHYQCGGELEEGLEKDDCVDHFFGHVKVLFVFNHRNASQHSVKRGEVRQGCLQGLNCLRATARNKQLDQVQAAINCCFISEGGQKICFQCFRAHVSFSPVQIPKKALPLASRSGVAYQFQVSDGMTVNNQALSEAIPEGHLQTSRWKTNRECRAHIFQQAMR